MGRKLWDFNIKTWDLNWLVQNIADAIAAFSHCIVLEQWYSFGLLAFDRNPCFHGLCVKHHPFNIIGGAIAITYLKDMFRWQKCFEKYTLNLYPIVYPKEFRSGLNSHVFLLNKITWASSLIVRFTASKAMQERPRRHEVGYGGASQITLNGETEVVADQSE